MWAALIIRILRRRIVLAVIFTLSLTYCVVNLWQENGSDYTSQVIDSDGSMKKLGNSFLWHSENESNQTNQKVVTCRNSVQGKVLIVDDKGYVCSRSDVMPSGCCNTASENTKRFPCDTCRENGCCSIYEYCTSCCLHPDKPNAEPVHKVCTMKIPIEIQEPNTVMVKHQKLKQYSPESRYKGNKKLLKRSGIWALSILAFILLAVIIYFIVVAIVSKEDDNPPLTFTKAAVASNGYLCAKIGKDILQENGTAVDAAIATLICEGVVCFQSMGIGGGFLMTIYDKKSGKVEVLNARETAPIKASENMYSGNKTKSEKGGLAVAVPSELRGYHEAYLRYGGGVPWKRLFEPTIKICREGFEVHEYLGNLIHKYRNDILESPTLREVLYNPGTKKLAVEGDIIKRPNLADFLEVMANEGVDEFYTGRFAKQVVKEIQEEGGILSEEDLKSCTVNWVEPVHVEWGPYKMYSASVPGSGELLAFMLNILRDFIPSDGKMAAQRFIETFKWGYGRRTELGDLRQDNFVPDPAHLRELLHNLTSASYANEIREKIKDNQTSQDPKFYGADVVMPDNHGTCHASVLAPNGDAVSVTSTINLVFGAKFISRSTGIVFNNEMSDFSAPNIENPFGLPPSPSNYIRPGKRPLSSMCPSIFLNKENEVVLVTGASGGTRITSTVAYIAYHTLMGNKTVKEAIDLPRLHHQLFPMEADYETGFPLEYVSSLQSIGHKTMEMAVTTTSTATSVGKFNGVVSASYDYRRGGSVDGF